MTSYVNDVICVMAAVVVVFQVQQLKINFPRMQVMVNNLINNNGINIQIFINKLTSNSNTVAKIFS